MSEACGEGTALGKHGKACSNPTSANHWNTSLLAGGEGGEAIPIETQTSYGPPAVPSSSWVEKALPIGRWLAGGPRTGVESSPVTWWELKEETKQWLVGLTGKNTGAFQNQLRKC